MAGRASRSVEVHFLDVGQGHATVLVDRGIGKAILVDCPPGGVRKVRSALTSLDASLSTSFITHFDQDHSAGVATLLGARDCASLVMRTSSVEDTKTSSRELRQIMSVHKRYGNLVSSPMSGAVGRIRWRRIGPSEAVALSAKVARSRNRESVCVLFTVVPTTAGGTERRILVLGDADGEAVDDLLKRRKIPRCDAVLWPHHGAAVAPPAVQAAVLAASSPGLVVLSVGSRNKFGHPVPNLVQALTPSRRRMACTEVTPQCHQTVTDATPCAGTVVARVSPSGGWSLSPTTAAYRQVIDQWSSPLCRAPRPAWSSPIIP